MQIFYYPGTETERIGNYLGLAQKAGKIAAGDQNAHAALKSNKAFLLVLAADVAESVRKELLPLAEASATPVIIWPEDKIALGLLLGKSKRGAVAVTDQGFAEAILKYCLAEQ